MMGEFLRSSVKHFNFIFGILVVGNFFFATYYAEASTSEEKVFKAYLLICSGQYERASSQLKAMIAKGDNSYLLKEAHTLMVPTNYRMIDNLLASRPEVDGLSEQERLLYASAMFLVNSKSIKSIEQLLNFESKDGEVESRRLFLQSAVENILKKFDTAFSSIKSALELSNGKDPAILHSFLVGKTINESQKELVKSSLKYINKMADEDPYKNNLKGHYNLVNQGYDYKKSINLFKSAYEACKVDYILALDYATALYELGDSKSAMLILERIPSVWKYYDPWVDILLVHVYADLGMEKSSLKSISKILSSKSYIDDETRKQIIGIRKNIISLPESNSSSAKTLGVLLLVGFFLVSCIFFVKRFYKK